MITSTVENYLKALFHLDPKGEKRIATGTLAQALEVTPGSASSMIKTLAESDFVVHRPHYGVQLTKHGRELAVHVVRRHRIVELFLVDILGMDWSQVHQEAEQLEHVVSDEVIEKMDALLGHPTVDPHGDPIPRVDGSLPTRTLERLSFCNSGDRVSIARMSDQNTSFLHFAKEHGLLLGAIIEVVQRNDIADSITVRCQEQEIVLGLSAASRIEVEYA